MKSTKPTRVKILKSWEPTESVETGARIEVKSGTDPELVAEERKDPKTLNNWNIKSAERIELIMGPIT